MKTLSITILLLSSQVAVAACPQLSGTYSKCRVTGGNPVARVNQINEMRFSTVLVNGFSEYTILEKYAGDSTFLESALLADGISKVVGKYEGRDEIVTVSCQNDILNYHYHYDAATTVKAYDIFEAYSAVNGTIIKETKSSNQYADVGFETTCAQ